MSDRVPRHLLAAREVTGSDATTTSDPAAHEADTTADGDDDPETESASADPAAAPVDDDQATSQDKS